MFNEQRISARKVLKTRAVIAFDGAAPLAARTIDVGANGVCISYPTPIQPGGTCDLSFELFMDGKSSNIKTRSKSTYCIFSNGEYKVGFQFVNIDLSAMTLLARFMR